MKLKHLGWRAPSCNLQFTSVSRRKGTRAWSKKKWARIFWDITVALPTHQAKVHCWYCAHPGFRMLGRRLLSSVSCHVWHGFTSWINSWNTLFHTFMSRSMSAVAVSWVWRCLPGSDGSGMWGEVSYFRRAQIHSLLMSLDRAPEPDLCLRDKGQLILAQFQVQDLDPRVILKDAECVASSSETLPKELPRTPLGGAGLNLTLLFAHL